MHIVVFHHVEHVVVTHIVKPMGNLRYIQGCIISLLAVQTLLQILTGFAYPTGHLNKGNHFLLQFAIAQQSIHRLNKDIDTLVAELIAATGRYNKRIIIQLFT